MAWRNFTTADKNRILALLAQSKQANHGIPVFNETTIPNQRRLFLDVGRGLKNSSFIHDGVKVIIQPKK